MIRLLLLPGLLFLMFHVYGQNVGDTIRVPIFSWDNSSRNVTVEMPDESISYERVILKYNMRCKGAEVSTSSDRNKGCGEWDYSCNTFVHDPNDIKTYAKTVEEYEFLDYDEDTLSYTDETSYKYRRTELKKTNGGLDGAEEIHTMAMESVAIQSPLSTGSKMSNTYYMLKAEDLIASGFQAGDIDALSIPYGKEVGEIKFAQIELGATMVEDIRKAINSTELTNVYQNSIPTVSNNSVQILFHNPYNWDGSSNVLMKISHSNVASAQLPKTDFLGQNDVGDIALHANSDKAYYLLDGAYIESNDYKGIGGQNSRTVEAWIKTNNKDGKVGICTWGTNRSGERFAFDVQSGKLELEVHSGYVRGTEVVADGQWHHVAVVFEGTSLQDIHFYVDGEPDPVDNILEYDVKTGITDEKSLNLQLSKGFWGDFYIGSIDEVRVWSKALDQETIKDWRSLHITSNHPEAESLEIEYRFDEGSGNVVKDFSGHNRHATIHGIINWVENVDYRKVKKGYSEINDIPAFTLHQGDFFVNTETESIDIPTSENIVKVIKRSIDRKDPNTPISDEVIIDGFFQYHNSKSVVLGEDGEVLEEIQHAVKGQIALNTLHYDIRKSTYQELISFVTPYGIGLDLGEEGKTWYFDVTHMSPSLHGKKNIRMTLGGQNQEENDVELLFIVGTPKRDILQFNSLWETALGAGTRWIGGIRNNSELFPTAMYIDENADKVEIRSSITGHGAEGEFHQNGGELTHKMSLDGEEAYKWKLTQDCPSNNIIAQGGTWIYPRQGWCPGQPTFTKVSDITSKIQPGDEVVIDYSIEGSIVSDGQYKYLQSHQLVQYGPLNHNVDARIIDIVKPNNAGSYLKLNPVCEHPVVVIENSGKEELNSIKFSYSINSGETQEAEFTELGLASDEVMEIELPSFGMFIGLEEKSMNTFEVEIVSVNGKADDYEHNNAMTSRFETARVFKNTIIIDGKASSRANENVLTLYDKNGQEVYKHLFEKSNEKFRDTLELDGCYTLELTDNSGDGLFFPWVSQGSGRVSIIENIVASYSFERDFGSSILLNFSTEKITSNETVLDIPGLQLYPNPVSKILYIEGENLSNYTIQCINALGQVMQVRSVVTDRLIRVNTSELTPGIYSMVLTDGVRNFARNFIIQ